MPWTFTVETSGSGNCRQCKKPFEADALRLGTALVMADTTGSTQYRHPTCVDVPQAKELLSTKSSWSDANLKGWGRLTAEQRDELTTALQEKVDAEREKGSTPKKPKGAAKGKAKGKAKKAKAADGAGSKRKKKTDDDDADDDDGGGGDKKKKKRAKKDPNAPKAALSAFLLWSMEQRKEQKAAAASAPKDADGKEAKFDHKQFMKELGVKWKALTEDDKKIWNDKAQEEKERYKAAMEEYKKGKGGGCGGAASAAAAADGDGDADAKKEDVEAGADGEEVAAPGAEEAKNEEATAEADGEAAAADGEAEASEEPKLPVKGRLKKMADDADAEAAE